MNKINRIKELVPELNKYRDYYYNHSESLVSDQMYDALFDELSLLEKETEFILPNSPTQSVGYEVLDKLEKVTHDHPMLSLDKTKSVDEIYDFIGDKKSLIMLKMDGLTASICFENGKLKSAETRGDGLVGKDVLSNMKVISNVPSTIPFKDKIVIDGEIIITNKDFEEINAALPEEEKYKHVRNLASGSIGLLDSKEAANRHMKFVAWKCVDGTDEDSFVKRLEFIHSLGFDVVPYVPLPRNNSKDELESLNKIMKGMAKRKDYPIDGLVVSYDSVSYGESLGSTNHHVRSQMAWKDIDVPVDTVLREVEWSASRTGLINPVAIFDTVEIEGTNVSRASLHNLSIIKSLKLGIGDTLSVIKANLIIPMVTENKTKSDTLIIPETCPVCGHKTIRKENADKSSESLYCSNPDCQAKHMGLFEHYVCRDAMNIEGLSSATLEKFVDLGYIKSFSDIYSLFSYHDQIVVLEGFGEKSYQKLVNAIEKSKNTTFARLLYSMGIPNVGRDASKRINKELEKRYIGKEKTDSFFNLISNEEDLAAIDGIGPVISKNLTEYFKEKKNKDLFSQILSFVIITDNKIEKKKEEKESPISGKVFVITGTVEHFKNREELKEEIEKRGGKVAGSVSAKTSYLINNDTLSNSSKNKKAKELGIKIISENDFLDLVK